MKNDSWRHPYETHFDQCYDDNKDGQLTGMETIFRDAYIDEENRKIDEAWKNSRTHGTNNTYSGNDYQTDGSGCLSTFVICFIVLVIVAYIKSLF